MTIKVFPSPPQQNCLLLPLCIWVKVTTPSVFPAPIEGRSPNGTQSVSGFVTVTFYYFVSKQFVPNVKSDQNKGRVNQGVSPVGNLQPSTLSETEEIINHLNLERTLISTKEKIYNPGILSSLSNPSHSFHFSSCDNLVQGPNLKIPIHNPSFPFFVEPGRFSRRRRGRPTEVLYGWKTKTNPQADLVQQRIYSRHLTRLSVVLISFRRPYPRKCIITLTRYRSKPSFKVLSNTILPTVLSNGLHFFYSVM